MWRLVSLASPALSLTIKFAYRPLPKRNTRDLSRYCPDSTPMIPTTVMGIPTAMRGIPTRRLKMASVPDAPTFLILSVHAFTTVHAFTFCTNESVGL